MLQSSFRPATLARCLSRAVRLNSSLLSWATCDPFTMSGDKPAKGQNLVAGKWVDAEKSMPVIDPMNGEEFISQPDTSSDELDVFVESLSKVTKSGVHNPLKNPERYLMYGDVSQRAAALMKEKPVEDFYTKLIQRCCPKSDPQARGECTVTRMFLENFSGDQVRFLARGFSNPGNHLGQQSQGYRWPFGPVGLVAPFNFPLEIPGLQVMGALYMGNKPVVKAATTTALVFEQFIRMLIHCGMPAEDLDYIYCRGRIAGELLERAPIRTLQFTGGSDTAERLCHALNGKIKVEDAGFDWKILGPDVSDVEYVAWQCDQDAYASSGQKCSAESILFAHENWTKAGLLEEMEANAATRKIDDLTVGPVLSHTTEEMLGHAEKLLKIPGAKLLFGGKELTNHTIPKEYGAIEPTAIFVPLEQVLAPEHFEDCTTEIFGPFQVVTEYTDETLPMVLEACERMENHLTAAVVSNDQHFLNHVLGNTVNGTTYGGERARTTGAPQNHWFGPCGDPRGAGIGTPEAIQLVWSGHREIIMDVGPVAKDWTKPKAT